MRKDDWLEIASHYEFAKDIKKAWRKSQIKSNVISKLVDDGVLSEEAFDLCDEGSSALEVKRLEIQYAREREERERQDRLKREEIERQDRLDREKREERERQDRLKREEIERQDRLDREKREYQLKLEALKSGSKGKISLIDESIPDVNESANGISVRIVRDTGSSHSLVVRDAVPGIENCMTQDSVILKSIGGLTTVPRAKLHVDCNLYTGNTVVGVVDSLPIPNIDFLLGNDIAGSRVIPDPVVVDTPLIENPVKELEENAMFQSCVVEHSLRILDTARNLICTDAVDVAAGDVVEELEQRNSPLIEDKVEKVNNEKDCKLDNTTEEVRESSLLDCNILDSEFHNLFEMREFDIRDAQANDYSLQQMFNEAVSESEIATEATCYYLKTGILMRKYRALSTPANASWDVKYQLVVPLGLREEIIRIAHVNTSAHLGVKKTTLNILQYFYWPGIREDVKKFCKVCDTCQKVGKPNQPIKPVPLSPQIVCSVPFEKVILDCVGPLPKSKNKNQYLMTVMCSSIRYPDAVPLRNISAKTLIPHLVKIFTQYGIPRIVQTDRGTNFTSTLFQEVMKVMGIKHSMSTVYHPQSQGCLERFHQTLKEGLTKFCEETGKDWEEGLPFVLYAVRNAHQESLGSSPAELLYGRQIRGPLKVLYDTWLDYSEDVSLGEYATNLREKLEYSRKFAHQHLFKAQHSMKKNFDSKAEKREFKVGNRVLMLTPMKKTFESRYEGPFTVMSKNQNVYEISTPGKRRDRKKVHINRLKLYSTKEKTEESIAVASLVLVDKSSDQVSDDHLIKTDVRLSNSDNINHLKSKLHHLPSLQLQDIERLLESFPAICGDIPTQTSLVEVEMQLKIGSVPVKSAPYRVSPYKKTIMKKEVDFLLEHGLAEVSHSPWSSPCVLVGKPDGTCRLCTDYRQVNQLTVSDCYPLPRIDDLIDLVSSSKFISRIDLLKGYYQLPLSESTKPITAFVTPSGLFQYKVLPFGLKNATAIFQRLMNDVLKDLSNVAVYLDDIIVFTDTWDSHLETLRKVFARLEATNLTLNLAKSDFGYARIQYLGYVVGSGEVAPVNAKVNAILTVKEPTCRKEVQRFLGMVGYYRRFCKNFSELVFPLTDLTSSKKKFQWTSEYQEAFDKAKTLLISSPVLKSPDFGSPFILEVDASEIGVGAVLLQRSKDFLLHPVMYSSQKFKPHQLNYSTIEKEALSLLLALEKFDTYLHSSPYTIEVYTDHQPLTFLQKMKTKNKRLMRWWLSLQDYDLHVNHIKGKDNLRADFLSRHPVM
ncbi:uncharacterized protein [Macrobrachium rosenbergii]|uniref:uncharacterized protein n=1 Tax=Macrobrachium rosenbergii TaxID=79674 RepID=UPI0034D76126